MKTIPLTQGRVALVDDVNYSWLNQWKWYAWQPNKKYNLWYALRNHQLKNGKRIIIRMHRLLLNSPKNKFIDHRDHNGLNNQRSNLRLCSNGENLQNQKKRKLKGVYKSSGCKNRWFSRVRVNKMPIHLGSCGSKRDAAKIYDKAALRYFGEFACPNFKKVESER
jgi:hypothetical protein